MSSIIHSGSVVYIDPLSRRVFVHCDDDVLRFYTGTPPDNTSQPARTAMTGFGWAYSNNPATYSLEIRVNGGAVQRTVFSAKCTLAEIADTISVGIRDVYAYPARGQALHDRVQVPPDVTHGVVIETLHRGDSARIHVVGGMAAGLINQVVTTGTGPGWPILGSRVEFSEHGWVR
jgi:hypothetical protein